VGAGRTGAQPVTTRILLADDHMLFRQGLRAMLEKNRDMNVVGEARNGRETVQLAQRLSPQVVIMDITMPDMNGIEATRKIVGRDPKIKVLALSMHSNRRFVLEILKAGAKGYLLKDCAFEELTAALRSVLRDKIYLSAEIADTMLNDYVRDSARKKDGSVFSLLTPREQEVLKLLTEGKSAKQIAYVFGLSVKTVETHRQKIMSKLNIHSIAEMTKYAIREGLTSLEK
jgi:DNA-binding NarL/FixJ family response regulator